MAATRRGARLLAFALLASLLLSPARGQTPAEPFYEFSLEGPSAADEPVVYQGGWSTVPLLYRDLSRDAPTQLAGVPFNGTGVPLHAATFRAAIVSEFGDGWQAKVSPSSTPSYGGQEYPLELRVRVDPPASNPHAVARVTATIETTTGDTFERVLHVAFVTNGIAGFNALSSGGAVILSPDQVGTASVRLINEMAQPRDFDATIVSNPCNLAVGLPPTQTVDKRPSQRLASFSVRAPNDQFWYNYESCTLQVQFAPVDDPSNVKTAVVVITVNGFYVDPTWVFWAIALALVALLIFLIAKRKKERREEEHLGKPQKPWLIPVEATYLRKLKEKDPRAWYVVRHYLMEDEHRSALLWYNAYRAATKQTRSKEVLVVRQERAYERWKAKWEARIAKPMAKADRYEAKLQRKLDRKARRRWRKERAKVRADNRSLVSAHAKRVEREQERWEKAARKASKKGLVAPLPPDVPAPAMAAEPELRPIPLASHRWAKKAARFRARCVRRVGDLEVRFERADARKLQRVERKVQALARRLDDPEFVADHPLLRPRPQAQGQGRGSDSRHS